MCAYAWVMVIMEEKMKRRESWDKLTMCPLFIAVTDHDVETLICIAADISITSTCDNTCTLYQQKEKWVSILNKKIRVKITISAGGKGPGSILLSKEYSFGMCLSLRQCTHSLPSSDDRTSLILRA